MGGNSLSVRRIKVQRADADATADANTAAILRTLLWPHMTEHELIDDALADEGAALGAPE